MGTGSGDPVTAVTAALFQSILHNNDDVSKITTGIYLVVARCQARC